MVLVRGAERQPDAVVRRLNAETVRIFRLPEFQKRRDQDAFDPKEFTPEQLTAYFESEIKRWAPVAQEAGMKKSCPGQASH